jgi:hypothetical protein
MIEINLMEYTKSIYSQQGQDGILEKIYDLIGTTNKFFVEFGSNGRQKGGGNTAYLREFGFHGLLMDGYEAPYGEEQKRDYPVNIEFITAENINTLFEKYSVPEEFDLLSIDIDGQDFHVWNALSDKYKPRVIVIESNYEVYSHIDVVQKYDVNWQWDGTHRHGASILALRNLGLKKGYDLVAYTGADGIFVRQDALEGKNVKFLFSNDVDALWAFNFQQETLSAIPALQQDFMTCDLFFPSSYFLERPCG